MKVKHYTARKLKPKESWIIEFRHPLLHDSSGKPGKKVRRGLGTTLEDEANRLTEQMNVLLSSEEYWLPGSYLLARDKFDAGIVDAFYDGLEQFIDTGKGDYDKTREQKIPLKTSKEGYTQTLLLGATGAGKTTLLRQLMGTDPDTEKFPATSPARTTVFDTEIILSEGDFKGIVTFYSESETREMIRESVRNAILEAFTNDDDETILRILLEDKEQRFRLSYIIGKIKDSGRFSKYDDADEGTEEDNTIETVSTSEQKEYESKIKLFLEKLKVIKSKIVSSTTQEYTTDVPSDESRKILNGLIASNIEDYDDDDLSDLVDEILEEVKLRFKRISPEHLTTEKFGWPKYWYKESPDREEFIQSLRFFSSNASGLFGKLLTPLVSGMRVQGPFKPSFLNAIPKLVLLDGEGLGHIPNTTSSLPSKVIKKLDRVDAIILVDNAQNPMLASPYAVIKGTAISGHYGKLFLAFTHFDAVKGDSLVNIKDKTEHVFASVINVLENLKNELEYDVKAYLSKQLRQRSYYMENIDEALGSERKFKFTIDEITNLTNDLERQLLRDETTPVALEYDISTLLFRIQRAASSFHDKWNGLLHGGKPGIDKAHHTQLKAFTKRAAFTDAAEYRDLKPVPDFWTFFNSQISTFLSSPSSYHPSNASEAEKQEQIRKVQTEVGNKIMDYGRENLRDKQLNDWRHAHAFKGLGSTAQRIQTIERIYSLAAPIPKDEMNPVTRKFVVDVMSIITESIKKNEGKVSSIFSNS